MVYGIIARARICKTSKWGMGYKVTRRYRKPRGHYPMLWSETATASECPSRPFGSPSVLGEIKLLDWEGMLKKEDRVPVKKTSRARSRFKEEEERGSVAHLGSLTLSTRGTGRTVRGVS